MTHGRMLMLFYVFHFTFGVHSNCSRTNPKYPDYPSETPDTVKPTNYGYDYERRVVMIPMRDGVKLHTVILVPNGAKNAPILLTRTPYSADALTTNTNSSHLDFEPLRL